MPISIGIPFYNAERFLPDAIRSVFAQTYQDWELILVDDGSTDRSLEIVRSVDDPRVRVIADGKNKKLAARLNQLVAESRYDIVARMDADDMMFPERIEKQIGHFEDDRVQVVSSTACSVDDDNNILAIRSSRKEPDVSPWGVGMHRHFLLHPTMTVRRSWYLENPYDPCYHVAEDLELFFRSTVRGTLDSSMTRLVREPLLFYREDGSQNLAKTLKWNRHFRKVIATYCNPETFSLRQRFLVRSLWFLRNQTSLVAAMIGILPWFKRLRAYPLENLEHLQDQLDRVRQTPVPGMDEYLAGISCRSGSKAA